MIQFHCYFILVFANFFLSLYQPPKEAPSYGVFCRNFLFCLQSPPLTIPVTCSLSQTVTWQRKKPLWVWFIKTTAVTGCLRSVLGRWLLPCPVLFFSSRFFDFFFISLLVFFLFVFFFGKLGSLSNNDGEGCENVIWKVNSRCFKLNRAYFMSFMPNSSNVGRFRWS